MNMLEIARIYGQCDDAKVGLQKWYVMFDRLMQEAGYRYVGGDECICGYPDGYIYGVCGADHLPHCGYEDMGAEIEHA